MKLKHPFTAYRSSIQVTIANILLLFIFIAGSTALAQNSTVYDVTSDFESGFEAATNPNGTWTYCWSHGILGFPFLFTVAHVPSVNNGKEHMWSDPENSWGFTPSVARNSGADFNNGNVTMTGGAIIMHPGGTDGMDYAHVVWTAPSDGIYSLSSMFFAQQNGINVDVHVLVNGVDVFTHSITSNGVSRPFAQDFQLITGSTIDFAVGPNDDFNLHAGNTGLTATIQKVTSSTPSDNDTRSSKHNDIAIKAAPNPFTKEFTLRYELASSAARVEISDMMGQIVETKEITNSTKQIILGSDLPAGAYFVEIIDRGEHRRMLVHKVK